MSDLSLASLDDQIAAANPGPRFLWTPWTGFINLDRPPKPPVLTPDPFFGRKRRARRFRPRIRQHRAYMANVRAFIERLRAHNPHATDPR